MTLPLSPLRSRRSAAILAALVACVVYANSLGNGFAFDDISAISNNEAVHDLSGLPRALGQPYWTNEGGRELGLWRPITTTVFAVEWALWGENPTPYHAVNVVVHAAATGVGTLLLAELVPVGAAFLGGLLFAVHPVHVEAVANVVGVAELLAALLLFSACLVYLRRGRERLAAGTVALLTGLYAAGFLVKESAAVLPALLVLLDAWKDRLTLRDLPGYLRSRALLFGCLAAAAGAILWLRLQVLGSVASAYPPLGADLLQEIPRIWTLPLVWVHYVRLLFFPADLIPDYSPSVIELQIGWNAANLAGVAIALSFLGLAWAAWRAGPEGVALGRSASEASASGERVASTEGRADGGGDAAPLSPLALGVLWFGVAVLPVANVLFLSGVLLAERTLYIPSFGFALAAGSLLWLLRVRWPRVIVAGVAVALVALGGRTWTASPAWKDTPTLFKQFLSEHPESGRVQWMLADRFWRDRDDPERALELYRLAVGINGRSYPMMREIVGRLLELGAHEQAATLALWQWRDRPDLQHAPMQLALARSRQGRHAEVLEPGRAALELEPENPVLHHLMAGAYRETEAWEDAVRHRRAAIEHGEGERWQQWEWLAKARIRVGDTVGALAAVDSARTRASEPTVRSRLDSLRATLEEGHPMRGAEGSAGRTDGAEEEPKDGSKGL